MTSTADLTGDDLGGMVITAGVYSFSSSVGITGTLNLDGHGNSNSLFVFQIGSTLITATAAIVKLTNGAQASNIFWQVGSSATFGTSTTFVGTVLAYTSITLNSNVAANGGMFVFGAAVTMIDDTVKAASRSCNNNESCASSSTWAPATRTQAPSTEHPSTEASSTSTVVQAISTAAPLTNAPSTAAPLTEAPSTEAPFTDAPSTDAPSTAAPLTEAPLTMAPSTKVLSTKAPSTNAPSTNAPSTKALSTEAPSITASPHAPSRAATTRIPIEATTTSTAAPTKTSTTEKPVQKSTKKPEQDKSTNAVTNHATKHEEKTTLAQPSSPTAITATQPSTPKTNKPFSNAPQQEASKKTTQHITSKPHDSSKQSSQPEHGTRQLEGITSSLSSEDIFSSWSSSSEEDEQESDQFESWPLFNQRQSNLNLPLTNQILSEKLANAFNDGARYKVKCNRCALRRVQSASRCSGKKICYGCDA